MAGTWNQVNKRDMQNKNMCKNVLRKAEDSVIKCNSSFTV